MLKQKITWYEDGKPIEGRGGGGKGKGDAPTEAADTLFSNSIGTALDLLSEGEIEGLVGTGFEGIYYNETQFEQGGTENFDGVTVAGNNGLADQPALRGFDNVRSSVAVGQDLPPFVDKTITFANAGLHQSVDITIAVQNFFQVQDDGDTVGTSCSFVVERSQNGGAYTQVLSATISGKQRDEYQVDYRIPITDTAGITGIRVRRTKADPGSLKIQDDISWKTYTKVTEHALTYPNCAVYGHTFSAKQFGNQIPTRQYHIKGLKVSVPHNYDPVARTYTGNFNGSLSGTKQYTNNPAWIFYDLVTHSRYGLGQFIDSTLIDKTSLYKIGQWCDELVYKGTGSFSVTSMTRSGSTVTVTSTNHGLRTEDFVEIIGANETDYNGDWQVTVTGADTFTFDIGGLTPGTPATGTITFKVKEPRWTCNTVINKRGEAFNLLKTMVSSFRGILFWMDSSLWAQADQPRTPVKIVTNANVIDGTFTYSGESNRSRSSVIKVGWNDPEIMYRKAIEVYEDPALIQEIGYKPKDFGSFGCTSRGQAQRLAKAILYSQEYESELVTYRASFDHTAVNDAEGAEGIAPGDLIWIGDSERGNAVAGGRLVGVAGSTLTLDRDTGGSGTGASLYIEHDDGTVETVACNYSADTVTLTGSPTGTVKVNDLFILIDSGFEAEPFRVIRVSEAEPHIFEITAVKYDEGKFNSVYDEQQYESAEIMQPPDDYSYVQPPQAPLTLTEGYIYNATGHVRVIDVSWTASVDPLISYYEISYSFENSSPVTIISGSPNAQIQNVRGGAYDVSVVAVNRLGLRSRALTGSTSVSVVPGTSLLPLGTITGLSLEEGGSNFNERDAEFEWSVTTPTGDFLFDSEGITTDTGVVDPAFRDFLITIRTTGDALIRTASTTDNRYIYTYEQNYKDNAGSPLRNFKIQVQYRDIYGQVSTAAELTVSNPAPAFGTQPTVSPAVGGLRVDMDNDDQPDFSYYNIYASLSSSFTPGAGNLIGQAVKTGFLVPTISEGVPHYVRVEPVDVYGAGTLSNELSATPLSAGVDGLNVATVFLYQRAASPPSVPSGTTTFTFATGVLTGIDNGWTQSVPASDGNPLYVTTATASSTGATDNIPTGEWASPSVLAQDGDDGSAGAAGLNNATVYIYQRAASPPTLPSVTTTYTFATGGLSGLNNGWTTSIPAASGNPLYVSVATASANTATDTIAAGEWAAASILAQDGADGNDGAAGLNNATVYIYRRSASVPTLPSLTTTYTFSTGVLTNLNNSWTQAVPAGTDPLYVSVATASSSSTTDTIAAGEWASPVVLAQDGTDGTNGTNGTNGTDGLNVASVFLYRRTWTNNPTVPTTTATFTFSTGVLTGQNNSWTQTVPDGIEPLWVTTATASALTSTDTIPTGEWASPKMLAKNPLGAVPNFGAGQIGGTGDLSFKLNYTSAVTANDGEIWVEGTEFIDPEGTTRTHNFNGNIFTPLEGGANGQLYVVYTTTAPATRFSTIPTEFGTNGFLFVAIYEGGVWKAYGNSGGKETFTPLASDVILAHVESDLGATNLTGIHRFIGRVGADGTNGTNGTNGTDGDDAISGYLTNEQFNVPAWADGNVASYTGATGSFKVFSGNTDVSTNFSLSTVANPQSLTVNYTSQTYTVTGGLGTTEDTAALTIRATGSGPYAGVTLDKVFTLGKNFYGYEIVGALPGTNLFEGRMVFLTTDNKLYRYVTGTGWTTAVPATDITGTLTDAQIASLAATKITGQLTDTQLAAIAAAKITGQLVTTQITDDAITTPKINAGAVTSSEIAANTITAGNIAALTITASEIAASTITGAKIAAGTIQAGNIAANTITANEIAANAITASELNANAVTADKILAGAVTAAKISVTDLASINANIGTITSGVLRNTGDTTRLDLNSSYLQFKDTTNMFVLGLPFATPNYIAWFGPQGTLASATDANAKFYLKANGDAFFNGSLGASNVDTQSVQNDAITDNNSAYTAGGYTVTTGGGEQTIQSVAVTTDGGTLSVYCSVALYNADVSGAIIKILRGTTEIVALPSNLFTGTRIISFSVNDSPSAGSYTYYLKASASSTGYSATNRSLVVLETKK